MGALFEKICSLAVLMDAWKRVRAKGARGGLDRMTVKDFSIDIAGNIRKLLEDLKTGRYTPEPLERINAPKMNGTRETRPLSLPSIRDKIAQQAVRSVIEPLFESVFLDCSYAYRAGKGPGKAFKRVNHYLTTEKRRFVALVDFDRFFDSLDQDILLGEVGKLVTDADIIRLIRMWCRIGFVDTKARYFDMDTGIGQGSVISPLLSNIYAHPLDQYMVRKGYAYVRYSDNMIVLSSSRKDTTVGLNDLTVFAREVLKLSLNDNSQPVKSLEHGFVFLGIYYQGAGREISRGKIAKIMRKLKAVMRPGDLVNSVLNYGYGILYGRVWRAVALAGLNPYLSFLHEPQDNKPTLVFDMIEEFRSQAVDRAAFTMFTRGEELKLDKKTGLLTEETRKKVIQNVLERLASLVPYRGKRTRLGEVIRLQPGHLAHCLKVGKKYRPFVGRY